MMQAAESREGHNSGRLAGLQRNSAPCWRILLKGIVDPVRMLIRAVIPDQTTEMTGVEHNHLIQQLSSAAFDPAFGNSILPWTSWTYAYGFDATGFEQISHFSAKLAVTIENHVTIGTGFSERLPQLLHNPSACRVFGQIEMKDPSPAVLDDEETIQDSESKGRDGEEVHGRNYFTVIAQESSPELAGLPPRIQTLKIAGNSSLRDIEAKFQELAVNSGRAPGGILRSYASDEGSDLSIELWSAKGLCPRSKPPEQTEACSMPGDDSLWFDDDQDAFPCRPEAAEQNPEHPILDFQPRSRLSALEHSQLLTENEDLKSKTAAGTEKGTEAVQESCRECNHERGFISQKDIPAPGPTA